MIDKCEWFRKERSASGEDTGVDIGLLKAGIPVRRWKGSLKRDKKSGTISVGQVKVRVASVLFVLQTPNGDLAKTLRQEMDSIASIIG